MRFGVAAWAGGWPNNLAGMFSDFGSSALLGPSLQFIQGVGEVAVHQRRSRCGTGLTAVGTVGSANWKSDGRSDPFSVGF